MAQMTLSAVGGILGSYFGPIGSAIGSAIGGIIGGLIQNALSHKKGTGNAAQNLGMSSMWGAPIPKPYGTIRLGGQMIWCSEIITKNKNGKGNSSGPTSGTLGEEAFVSFAVALGAGPVSNLIRMWADGQLIYDTTTPGSQPYQPVYFNFYNGGEDQQPDPYIAQWVEENVTDAPDAAPAFRGLCYIMFANLNMQQFGYRIPQISAEITTVGVVNLPILSFQLASPDDDEQADNTPTGTSNNLGLSNFTSAGGPITIDYTSQVIYVGDGSAGYRVLSLSTMSEIGRIVVGSEGTPAENSPGQMVVEPGGYLWASPGSANSSVLYRYDPNTLQPAGSIGTLGTTPVGFSATTLPGISALSIVTVSATTQTGYLGYDNYVLAVGIVGGSLGVFYGDLYLYVSFLCSTDDSLDLPVQGLYATTFVIPGLQGAGYSEAWILNSDERSGTVVNVLKMTILGRSKIDPSGISLASYGQLTQQDFVPGAAGWTGAGISNGVYDSTDNTIILSSDNAIIKWNPEGQNVVWNYSTSGAVISNQSNVNGNLCFMDGTNFVVINTATGGIVSSQAPTLNAGNGTPTSGQMVISDSGTGSLVYAAPSGAGQPFRAYYNLSTGGPLQLSAIVTDICLQAGLTLQQIDVSQISNTTLVQGYTIDSNQTAREALQILQQAFLFDCVESDYTLKFVPRGQPLAATIPQSALGSVGSGNGDGNSDGNYWQHTRAQEQDLPSYIQVNFTDGGNENLPNATYAKRSYDPIYTTKSKQRQFISLPIVMGIDEAQIIAQTILWFTWAERDTYETVLGLDYVWLDPSDTIQVNFDDGTSTLSRITSMELGADGSIKLATIATDVQVYSQTTSIVATSSPYIPKLNPPTQSRLFLLNLPLLRDTDANTFGSTIYYALGGYGQSFTPAVINTSPDGLTYTAFDYVNTSVTWGACLNALQNTKQPFSTDRASQLVVNLVSSNTIPSSITYAQLIAGGNAALVGQEIIQFQTVTVNDDGTLTLTNIIRGRRGTDWACGTHVLGEAFILLDTNMHVRTIPQSEVGVGQYLQVLPIGTSADNGQVSGFTFLGYDEKPYAPTMLARSNDASGDVVVTWIRRDRIGGNLLMGQIPLSEATESYDAYIMAAPYSGPTNSWGTPATFVRSFIGLTSPTFTYTSADMSADGFTASSTLHVVVFQNSAKVGHGWPAYDDIQPGVLPNLNEVQYAVARTSSSTSNSVTVTLGQAPVSGNKILFMVTGFGNPNLYGQITPPSGVTTIHSDPGTTVSNEMFEAFWITASSTVTSYTFDISDPNGDVNVIAIEIAAANAFGGTSVAPSVSGNTLSFTTNGTAGGLNYFVAQTDSNNTLASLSAGLDLIVTSGAGDGHNAVFGTFPGANNATTQSVTYTSAPAGTLVGMVSVTH